MMDDDGDYEEQSNGNEEENYDGVEVRDHGR
jgi:hypothetical protein